MIETPRNTTRDHHDAAVIHPRIPRCRDGERVGPAVAELVGAKASGLPATRGDLWEVSAVRPDQTPDASGWRTELDRRPR